MVLRRKSYDVAVSLSLLNFSAVPCSGRRAPPRIQTVGAMTSLQSESSLGVCQHAMAILQDVGRLYSVETLDTRFTTSLSTPSSHIDSAKPQRGETLAGRNNSQKQNSAPSPSRWKTPEFLYHYIVFLVVVPWMFYTVFDVSQRKPFLKQSLSKLTHAQQRAMPTSPNSNHYSLQAGFLDVELIIQTPSMQVSETTCPTCSPLWPYTLCYADFSILYNPSPILQIKHPTDRRLVVPRIPRA